jgi:hypothetical protein
MEKLTPQDHAAIRELYFKNWVTDAIGEQFDLSGQAIRRIIKENGWIELRKEIKRGQTD